MILLFVSRMVTLSLFSYSSTKCSQTQTHTS